MIHFCVWWYINYSLAGILMHMHGLSLEKENLDTVEVEAEPAGCLIVTQQKGQLNIYVHIFIYYIYHNTNNKNNVQLNATC